MVSNQTCWQTVYALIDWEHRLVEDDFEDPNVEDSVAPENYNYACGMLAAHDDHLDMLIVNEGMDPGAIIRKAEEYASDDGPNLIPLWIQESDYNPNPRFEEGVSEVPNFTSLEEEVREDL